MMVTLPKARRESYWWNAEGEVSIETNLIESIEQCYDTTPGGSRSTAYVKITMASGATHLVYKPYDEVMKVCHA
jgi:hypothetical protein